MGVPDQAPLASVLAVVQKSCPVVEVNLEASKALSDSVRSLVREVGLPSVRLSLDEFALDVRWARDELGQDSRTAHRLLERLSGDIRKETGLVPSIGVSKGRYGARIAATQARPGGMVVVEDIMHESWWDRVRLDNLPGVRQIDVESMEAVGVRTVKDLKYAGQVRAEKLIGRVQGAWLWNLAQGSDPAELPPESADRLSLKYKSRFSEGAVTESVIERALKSMNTEAAARLLDRRSTVSLLRVTFTDAKGKTHSKQTRLAATRSYGVLQETTYTLAQSAIESIDGRLVEVEVTLLAQSDTVRHSLWDEAHVAAGRREGLLPSGYVVTHPAFGDGVVLGSDSGMVRVQFRDRDRWLYSKQLVDDDADSLLRLFGPLL